MNESEAQREIEQHLEWCNELLWEEEGEERTSPEGWQTFGPYCGCDTCVVREILGRALELDCFQWVGVSEVSVPNLVQLPGRNEGSDPGTPDCSQVSADRPTEREAMGSKAKYRISISRGVGMTTVSLEAPQGGLTNACEAAKDLLQKMPESTFQGDGVSISTIPGFGPTMFPDGGKS